MMDTDALQQSASHSHAMQEKSFYEKNGLKSCP